MKKFFVIAFIMVAVVFISAAVYSETGDRAETDTERRNLLLRYGWETGELSGSETVTLPPYENDVYKHYNKIQKRAGFDLEDYYGRTVVRYTYRVLNHKQSENVYANILVCDGRIIAGDIMVTSISGFMHALNEDGG